MQSHVTVRRTAAVAIGTLVLVTTAACSATAPTLTAAPSVPASSIEPPGATLPNATPPPSSTLVTGQDLADVARARILIEGADLADPAGLDSIGGALRLSRTGEQAAREIIESGVATTSAMWAAVWVYASAGSDPVPLRVALEHSDPSVRSLAAAKLVSLGDASGFKVLAAALADQNQMSGSEPPITIASYASWALANYTDLDNAPTAAAWPAWLAEHEDSVVFDSADGRWRLP